jgi:orotidine-5'-phosphate decarboxylase
MKKERRLIIALDVEEERALSIAEETSDLCDAFKVNYPLVLSAGLRVVDRLASEGDIICDFKVADIPDINRMIVEQVFRHSASGVIIHGFTGQDSLRACIEAADGEVFVVALMSHPGADRFMEPVSEDIARMARESGATGIVVGATRPAGISRLREAAGSLLILSPGVGPQGGDPVEALRAGADHLIVGRRITAATDPRRAAEEILEEIRQV